MSKKEKTKNQEEEAKQTPETTVEEVKEPTIEDELAQAKEQLLRTAAEYANFRTRSAKEKEQTYANAKGNVIAEILPAIDYLERAVASPQADYDSLKKGVEMTLEGIMATLEKLGVECCGSTGEQFDPNFHNAVMHIEDESLEDNVIVDVFQKGYKIGDRVIRPAMVKTAN